MCKIFLNTVDFFYIEEEKVPENALLSAIFHGAFLAEKLYLRRLSQAEKLSPFVLVSRKHSSFGSVVMEQIQEETRIPRKDRRFLVHDRTLAQVGLAPGVLFHIIDISRGGLAFRYLGDHELAMLPTELDIIRDEQFALSKIPIKPVSDCSLAYGYIPMRRRSVKFGELTPWQKAELDHFLQNFVGAELH